MISFFKEPGIALAVLLTYGACNSDKGTAIRASASPRTECQNCECSCNSLPRWVLRDKDGVKVNAHVEPRCTHQSGTEASDECDPVNFVSELTFPCVRIIDHEGRYINLQYYLKTGTLEECMKYGGDDPQQALSDVSYVVYLDDACQGEPHRSAIPEFYFAPFFVRSQDLLWAEDQVWYLSGHDCHSEKVAYTISADTSNCISIGKGAVCPLKPVPQWVRELLPNPPYSLSVEYQ